MLSTFDLILTMERRHEEALRFEFPDQAEKIYLLSEMVDQDHDIADPIGQPISEYEKTADEIMEVITKGFDRIIALAMKDQASGEG
jgi:protein-tyrosine-phosphatase